MAPKLTLSRAAVGMCGLSPTELHGPELTDEEKCALKSILAPESFDLTQPIRVDELPDHQGFHLTQ
jgi:hypothetical protein